MKDDYTAEERLCLWIVWTTIVVCGVFLIWWVLLWTPLCEGCPA